MSFNHTTVSIDHANLRHAELLRECEQARLASQAEKANHRSQSRRVTLRNSARGLWASLRLRAPESAPAHLAMDWEAQG